jgi:hypothetical protein
MSNGSKPYQGFAGKTLRPASRHRPWSPTIQTPHAISMTNAMVRSIYKSLSGIRSIVRRLQPDQLPRLSLLRNGPAQFQAFIPGADVRVHTVGGANCLRHGCVPMRSTIAMPLAKAEKVEMEPTILPPAAAESCLNLAHWLDLLMTGIDLERNARREYYCFEVNPSPGFIYYEKNSRQPISAALATCSTPASAHQPSMRRRCSCNSAKQTVVRTRRSPGGSKSRCSSGVPMAQGKNLAEAGNPSSERGSSGSEDQPRYAAQRAAGPVSSAPSWLHGDQESIRSRKEHH